MDWNIIKAIAAISSIMGVVLIAAAKSIFASKNDCEKMHEKIEKEIVCLTSKLYEKGVPVYVLRTEWYDSKDKRAQQAEKMQQHLFDKIDRLTEVIEKLRDGQDKTNIAISQLQVRRTGD